MSAATMLLESLPHFLFSHRSVQCLLFPAHQISGTVFTQETTCAPPWCPEGQLIYGLGLPSPQEEAQLCKSHAPSQWYPERGTPRTHQHRFPEPLGELHPVSTCNRSPYGHAQRLRPVNTSAYTYNNVSSIHRLPCLFNSPIHTAPAVLLQTITSISSCTPSNCAQSR